MPGPDLGPTLVCKKLYNLKHGNNYPSERATFHSSSTYVNTALQSVTSIRQPSQQVRPRLFYLLDYGFLPQNVSEVGGKKKQKNSVTRKYKSSPSAITAI
jgi:hypothetical protein